MELAVLTWDAGGEPRVERHDGTANHVAWLGAVLVVVVSPARLRSWRVLAPKQSHVTETS
jgi:hypothetical protein